MIDIWTSPIRFYRSRVSHPPDWIGAAVPVAIQMVLLSVSGSVTYLRGLEGVTENLPASLGADVLLSSAAFGVALAAVSVVAGVAMMFWLSAGALVVLDLLFAGSGHARRLVECTALAYWSQVPWSLVTVGILVWWFVPEPLRLPSGVSLAELPVRLTEYQAAMQSTPLLETMKIVGLYFGIWLVALQAVALRVVSGFSVGGTWVAGILLAALFVGLPYAAQWYW
ncbi:MAG: YIP1 family protein [Acidobacteria bacterium]|nr:YIP1 family protein [Acidobacteriota bacterium]